MSVTWSRTTRVQKTPSSILTSSTGALRSATTQGCVSGRVAGPSMHAGICILALHYRRPLSAVTDDIATPHPA